VAGLERGVRRWALVDADHLVDEFDAFDGLMRAGFVVGAEDLARQRAVTGSLMSVDLPAAGTPVTTVRTPSGISTSISLRLWELAPRITSFFSPGLRRSAGTAIARAPERYRPVRSWGWRNIGRCARGNQSAA